MDFIVTLMIKWFSDLLLPLPPKEVVSSNPSLKNPKARRLGAKGGKGQRLRLRLKNL